MLREKSEHEFANFGRFCGAQLEKMIALLWSPHGHDKLQAHDQGPQIYAATYGHLLPLLNNYAFCYSKLF